MRKYLVFTLIVLLSHNGLTDAKHIHPENSPSIWNDAKEALKELKENLIILAKQTAEELKIILDNFKQEAEMIVEEAKQLINDEIQKLLDEIETIKESAAELGVDITECVNEHTKQIEELKQRAVLELIQCITSKIHEAEKIVAEIKSEIDGVLETYKNLEAKLESCKDLTCVREVLKETAEITVQLPKIINKQVVKAKTLIENLRNEIKECISENVIIVREGAAEIIGNFSECIHGLIDVNSTTESRTALEDALKALKELKEKLENLIAESEQKLKQIIDEFKQEAAAILEQAKNEIYEEIAKILEALEKIKEEAQAIGVDISECIKEQEEKVKELEKRIIQELVQCVTGKIDEAVQIARDTVNEIKDVLQTYKDLKSELEACKTNGKDLGCIAKVLKEVLDKTTKLPIFILKQVAKAEKLIASLKGDLLECALEKVLIVKEEGGKIIEDFVRCVRDKIQQHEEIQV